jgi:hypothetical protein
MKFIFLESARHKFVGKYILPLFDPAVEYFSQYGISKTTVIFVPLIIFFIICEITFLRKDKFYFKMILIVIIMGVIAVIQDQFGWLTWKK